MSFQRHELRQIHGGYFVGISRGGSSRKHFVSPKNGRPISKAMTIRSPRYLNILFAFHDGLSATPAGQGAARISPNEIARQTFFCVTIAREMRKQTRGAKMITNASSEVYLDANATTPVLPEAADEAYAAMESLFGNPSSSHISGLRARSILESARRVARRVLGADTGQIVFTSGATEAIQMGVFSTLCNIRKLREQDRLPKTPRKLLYSATEHKAVPQAIRHWNQLLGVNNEVIEIPVDEQGLIDLRFLSRHAGEADLVCTMAVNNETGVISDIDGIESVIREANPHVAWMVDCVQAIGKMTMNLDQTSIDYAPISGHKIYAPKGIGLLYVRHGTPLVPLLAGGGQEQGARAGTENLPGVAAIAAVMNRLAESDARVFADNDRLEDYRDRIVNSLEKAFPTIHFNTPAENRVSTTINFAVKGFSSKELMDLFDAAGIRVSSGSACGSAVQGSYVLEAMGLPRWRTDGAIRLSFGPLATDNEIESACRRIAEAGRALCASCLAVAQDDSGIAGQALDGLIQLKHGSMCTWLLMDAKSKNCVIIDPSEELADRVESLVRCQESNIVAILDTHAHVDHESCREMLLQVLHQRILPTASSSDRLGWPDRPAGICRLDDGSECPFIRFSDNQVIAQIDMPGHTTIGKAFFVGTLTTDNRLPADNITFAFTGDTILIGGIGRTDFEYSSIESMYDSLKRLPRIVSPKTILCPTHDYNNGFATTLDAEMARNEFLRKVLHSSESLSLLEFQQIKARVDGGIEDEGNPELICGSIETAGEVVTSVDLHKDELKAFFEQHIDSLIIDVREPHEFAFEQDWSSLGFETPPENVPLTRLAGFLPTLMTRHQEPSQEIIFLCRSGKRSGLAAAVARRLGFKNARHIAGGLALNVEQKDTVENLLEPGYMI
jgi:cysteine desulfurase